MPSRKNQHYVPKMLLKPFGYGLENRQIDLINLATGLVIRGAPVKTQCSRDYFYGRDDVLEKSLGYFEGRFAKIIQTIRDTGVLEPVWHSDICEFLATQKIRTFAMAEITQELMEKRLKMLLYGRVEAKILQSVRLRVGSIPAFLASSGIILSLQIRDLEQFLVVNQTHMPFIISDVPVVETNRFCRMRYPALPNSGLSRSGVQLFMPISPGHGLMLHDSNVYTIHSRNRRIDLKATADVVALNRLQWQNAHQNVYLPPGITEGQLTVLAATQRNDRPLATASRYVLDQNSGRRLRRTQKDEYEGPTEGASREFIVTRFRGLPADIKLPGLAIRPRPIFQDDGSAASPARDLVWEQLVREFTALLDSDRVHFGAFRRFVRDHPMKCLLGQWFLLADQANLYA